MPPPGAATAPPRTAPDHPRVPAGRPVIDPTTEETLAVVPDTDPATVDDAVARADAAGARWAALAPADRARALRRFADVVDGHLDELAALETAEAGHPVAAARREAEQVRDLLEYAAGGVERLTGRQIPVAGGTAVTFAEPLGVVAVIAPWNFPLPIAAWGAAPALAAGNAVLLKPAEQTPLTALRLAELASEAGLPEGLFRTLPGAGAVTGEALVDHPGVAKVVFTGSTAVGRRIMARCAGTVKRLTLELGGKSPMVVFADADLERAAASAPGAFLDNAGQDCCARSRILVQKEVRDRFLELLEPAVRAVRVGDPRDPDTDMGPLISAAHRERVAGLVPTDTPALVRGAVPEGPGFWYPATVLAEERAPERARTEEIFGPVTVIGTFTDEDDAVRLANDTPYGLSGSIWTRDAARALRVSRGIRAGNLSVNSNSSVRPTTPFGGFKQSGLGRELGPDALAAFTETKTVFIDTAH
ncbi:aldehyde dehydrogenase family protein [Streptomyces calidiresistens]